MPRNVDLIKKDWSIHEASTPRRSPKKERLSPQVLRRSTRKRPVPASLTSVFCTPPSSAKKSRKITQVPSPPVPAPTLITLPYVVIAKLLLYLDVDALENLSDTCSYFDQMIAGRFLTSINFPFPVDFISEVMSVGCLEKKPLLKLRCKKTKDEFKVFPDMPDDYSEPSSLHKIIVDNCPDMTDYLVLSQISLLSLHKLREVDLVPDSVRLDGNRVIAQRVMDSYSNFDAGLLRQISRLGSLRHVTRLDVLVDQNFYLEQFMTLLPNLIELGLNILTRTGLSKHVYMNEYLPRLEAVVSASKAPVLKLTVVNESRRQVNKILKNGFIEKLIVTAPCTFNMLPVMERLKEVTVKFNTTTLMTDCTYWKSKADDRVLHRAGLCCVNFGAVYENCPNLEKFMGVEVGSVDQKMTFKKWNTRVKKKFYEYYQNQGGSKELKPWAKTRWFSRRPVVSRDMGPPRLIL